MAEKKQTKKEKKEEDKLSRKQVIQMYREMKALNNVDTGDLLLRLERMEIRLVKMQRELDAVFQLVYNEFGKKPEKEEKE